MVLRIYRTYRNRSSDTDSTGGLTAAIPTRPTFGLRLTWLEARGITEPRQVTLPVLERYRLYLHERRKSDGSPLGWGSQAQMLVAVKSLFRWLTLTKRTATNPPAEIELPRRAYRLPRAVLTADEAERVLDEPDTTKALGVRDRAILELLYSTGIRRAECTNLHLADIELGRGVLLVREGKGGRDRFVPLATGPPTGSSAGSRSGRAT